MKRYFIILGILYAATVCVVNAQFKVTGIGASVGTNYLIGDSRIGNSQPAPNISVYSFYRFTPKFNMKFQVGFEKLLVENRQKDFVTSFLPLEITGMFSFFNNQNFQPFLQAGLGVMGFSLNHSPTYFDGMIIGGAGAIAPINENLSFLINADLHYTSGDDFNGLNQGLKDGFFSFSTGITFHIKQKQTKYRRKNRVKEREILAAINPATDAIYFKELKNRTKVSNLENKLKIKNSELIAIQREIDQNQKRLVKIKRQIAKLDSNRLIAEKHIGNSGSKKAIQKKFNKALAEFDQKKYTAAISEFSQLLKRYPFHPLTADWYYWIGESYFGLSNYSAAAKAFEKSASYTYSIRMDDALVMAGISYMKLGLIFKARQLFLCLIDRYPRSEFFTKAKHYLAEINEKILS